MESILGFTNTSNGNTTVDNYKLVPWLNWDEWDSIRVSLFSSSPNCISKALDRIAAWRSRGCLPVAIDITASIIEIHQKDSHFGVDVSHEGSDSEEMLSMLYTMAIMRLVNGVIEKTRKKIEISIAEAAAAIDMPRMLIDIRHEGSHRELPSLRLLRLASVKALDWLKSYYWDPQKNAIPYQRGKSSNVRKEISRKLRELAFSLKVKESTGSNSLKVKEKRVKLQEPLVGAAFPVRNKLFSLMACKTHPSKYVGSHKHVRRTLKNLVRLYSFFSSDVVSVLLEILLKVPNTTDIANSPENFHINLTLDAAQTVFDEWKPVITKFSKKEPELLLSLLKAVLDMIEFRKAIKDDFGSEHFSLSHYDTETERIRVLSSLFTWLLLVLKVLKPPHNKGQRSQTEAGFVMPKPVLIELIRKCLHVSDSDNDELIGAAVLLGNMIGSFDLAEKLNKLSRLTLSSLGHTEYDDPSDVGTNDLVRENKHIVEAEEKLDLLKLHKTKSDRNLTGEDNNNNNNNNNNMEDTNTWTVAKTWNPCPIGMLPRTVGSSGCLPVLDCSVEIDRKFCLNSLDRVELRHYYDKREVASGDIEMMDVSYGEREREAENVDCAVLEDDLNVASMALNGQKGVLLIDGVWQKVGDQEVQDIKSRVSILVNKRVTSTKA